MIENREYRFNLLNEMAASEDLFEDKTHQKIADTLFEVIQNGSAEGITIGLEGGWGSGKSTVVSILKNKLETAKDITIYFYFDAWAHEGDPLRRVFLEALIDQVGHDDDHLQDIKSRISNRKKISKMKSKQTVTALGRWLALAALFVPLGVSMISGTASKIGFRWEGQINWVFLFGLICALAPFYVLICNGFKLLKNNKKLNDPDNWMFLQGESKSTVTQEVSEDEERSSIEFERYFGEILKVIFDKDKNKKLLIVVDNLDRVDAADSLKIWSTLQTFLQRRNSTDKGPSYLKRIWILVPYDEEGLEKLWKDPSTDRKCAKSFFDKCFQLRIEVPKLILTGWESFCKENIDQALVGWGENDKNEVLNVLKWTREKVNDIPTPREIKTYINQVGVLRMHCDKEISTAAIAYFAVHKYLRFQKNRDIEEHLVSGKIPSDKHKPIFHAGLTAELCGILFGVSPEKGQQILLEPEIENILNTRNINKIKELSEIHKNAFWTVLNLHLPNMNDFGKMTNYSFTVWNGPWKTSPDKCGEFVSYLKATFDKLTSLEFPTQNNVNDYMAMFSLLDFGNYDFSDIWGFITNSLNEKMNKGDFDYLSGNKILSDLASCQKKKMPSSYTLGGIPIENWIKWATASSSDRINTYVLVKPPDTILNEITSKIVAKTPIPDNLYDLIAYLVNGGEKQWQPVIKAFQGHIEWNQGTPSGNVFSIEIFRILVLLSTTDQDVQSSIAQIIKNGPFYNLTSHLKSQGAEKYAALLLARSFPENLDLVQIPVVGNSAQGLQLVKDFWKAKSDQNAQFIWNEIIPQSDFAFIWKLAEVENNKLVGDIIKIAVNENCTRFFNYVNALQLFKAAISVVDDEGPFGSKLAKCFIANSQIEKEILEADDLDIIVFSYELNLLVENTENEEVAKRLIEKISIVNKDQWDDALRKDTHLTALAVTINKKSPGLQLGDSHYASLLSYLQAWISNSATPPEAQKDELPELISMLKNSFQIQLKNRLANYLIEIGFKGSLVAVSFLLEHINIGIIATDGKEKIQNVFEDSIRKKDIDSLKIIDMILSHQDSATFRPAQHLAEVFKSPISELLDTQEGIDKALIERLASKFGVDLSVPQQNDENSERLEPQNAK